MLVEMIACYIRRRINYLILVKFVENPDKKSINVMGKQRTKRVKI